jgi:hypothetical protein
MRANVAFLANSSAMPGRFHVSRHMSRWVLQPLRPLVVNACSFRGNSFYSSSFFTRLCEKQR